MHVINGNIIFFLYSFIQDAVRNSVCHSATVIANGYMHCGTTSDQFLRDNLEWLAKSTNWAKFTATASLGVVHKGHESDALSLMAQYLPRDSAGMQLSGPLSIFYLRLTEPKALPSLVREN